MGLGNLLLPKYVEIYIAILSLVIIVLIIVFMTKLFGDHITSNICKNIQILEPTNGNV